ncbi:MAG: GNAT family N-acetyltransferase [Planctomycetes bacterium]|nr:GNAT family N-acetyltransferase [Planctomycetota bacterium]MCB9872117.1 GNAT family N-acetyltransferase [Planctomycetota bacterium]
MQDHFGLIELYETVFGHTATPAMWYWKYVPPWVRRHYCYVGRCDGRVIGYFGAVPLRGLDGDREVPYFQLADLMVHPEYRLKFDYFDIGSRHILEDIHRSHPRHVVYGFSGHRAFRFLERSGMAGFIEKAQTRYVRRADGAAPDRLSVERWRFDAPEVDEVWGRWRPRLRAGLIRDAAYLGWRYGSHPVHGYRLLGLRDRGEAIGWVVHGTDRPGEHGRAKQTPVVDLLVEPEYLRDALAAVAEQVQNDLILWLPEHVAPAFDEQKDSGTHCYHFVKESALDTAYLREHLYYTMGDVDWW